MPIHLAYDTKNELNNDNLQELCVSSGEKKRKKAEINSICKQVGGSRQKL